VAADPGKGSGIRELDAQLLSAKLAVPPARPNAVSRRDLIERARTSASTVIGITAPAGYGKSTLLVEWAHTEERAVVWVSLDRLDDDPASLIAMLASAFARAIPGSADVVGDVSGLGMSVLGRAAPRLAVAFRSSPTPFVLMVDDLHELRSPACHDVLSVVISGIPMGSQLVAASRSEQPHLPRLRASGDVLELAARDLALDARGAAQLFSAAAVNVTPELATTLTERTEGWPAGLYLAAMIVRDGDTDDLSISGDDPYVADYLYRESFLTLPATDQEFLRRTAVLDQLAAPLCDAVLGEPGSQERLQRLEAASQFLIPLDRRREWYRYHALFREFLLAELRRVEPEIISKLHLRAADWYEANGSPTVALEHLLATTERERCAHLVTELALPTYLAGQTSVVQRWLSAVGDATIKEYPPLAVIAGWIYALDGQTAEADRWAAFLETASFELVPMDGSASFESARAMLRSLMCATGPEQSLADATYAVASEPAWSPWRDQALDICGDALLVAGDTESAKSSFEAAIVASPLKSDAFVEAQSQLGLIAMDRGQWEDAAAHVASAVTVIDEQQMQDYPTSVLAFADAARIALHRGDLAEVHRRLTQAMRARPSSSAALPSIAVRARLQLAKVYLAIADHATAAHLLREIDDVLVLRPALGALVDEVAEFRELLTTTSQVGTGGGPPLTPAELRLLPYLQTHLTFREIGERLFVSRNTISTQCSSIYRKMGVSSRHDAVDHATAVGLLGG
jgi:LuxR family maltose regulon positive regulatory protein